MHEFFNQFIELLPFLTIPLVSAVVGWGTNVLALKMTFYPIEYVGIKPIGWQGIIPSKAKKMATISVDMMTSKLVDIEEIFEQLDPKRVADEMEESMQRLSTEIIDEVIEAQFPIPQLWHRTPSNVKELIYKRVADELPEIIAESMKDMKENIKDLLDLKVLVINILMEDKSLINQIFLNVGREEFKFVERSGFYFGFLFGLLQMGIFFFYDPWWILPLAGLLVGYATNWLALKLIFEPIYPTKILGLFTLQGLFIKRQKEVAWEYAKIIQAEILTTETIFEFIMRGPTPEKIARIVKRHIDQAVTLISGISNELIQIVAEKKVNIIKNIVQFKMVQELPFAIRDAYDYADKTLDIKNILATKMQSLSEKEFVDFLRPVFQEDEFTLILVGAALGCLAGFAQFFLFFN